MRTPILDVIRLLLGLLTVDDAKRTEWLQRGRRELERALRDAPRAFRDAYFPSEDPTPTSVRNAAYRVEARRSLTRAVDGIAIQIIAAGAVLGLALSLNYSIAFGLAATLVTGGLALLLRRRGLREASEKVPLRQGIEPLVWAMYYPIQMAQRVVAAQEKLEALGDESIRDRYESLSTAINRGPEGEALPGQDEALKALALFIAAEVPELFGNVDASRVLSGLLAARAESAAHLVLREVGAQVAMGLGWFGKRGYAVPQRLADRVYSYLMEESEKFATLPRLADPGVDTETKMGGLARKPALRLLVDACNNLVRAALDASQGVWPEATGEWERPRAVGGTIAAVVGGALLSGGGLVLSMQTGFQQLGHTLMVIGVTIVPGTIGKVLKEASALRPAPAPRT